MRVDDDVVVKIIEQQGNNQYKVRTTNGFYGILRSRSNISYSPGEELNSWIFDTDSKKHTYYCSDSSFGRFPVSDRMRPQYLSAINNTLAGNINIDDLSTIKGIFNRCIKKDQWDWCSVYRHLGYPSISFLSSGVRITKNSRVEIKENIFNKDRFINDFKNHLLSLEALKSRLEKEAMTLLDAKRFLSISKKQVDLESEQNEDKVILSAISKRKLDNANHIHKETLSILSDYLSHKGYIPQYNRLIDLFTKTKKGPTIFEVKSITGENYKSQIREGISQLYEYRYIHEIPEAFLCLVLSKPLLNDFYSEYIQKDREINLLYINNGVLEGDFINLL